MFNALQKVSSLSPLCQMWRISIRHLMALVLCVFLLDLPPIVFWKITWSSPPFFGVEDNFLVDGTSFLWIVFFIISFIFGFFFKDVRSNILSAVYNNHLIILGFVPFGFYLLLAVIFEPVLYWPAAQILLPLAHLYSFWIWFLAFRFYCDAPVLIRCLLLVSFSLAISQLLSAFGFIPGLELNFQQPENLTQLSRRPFLTILIENNFLPFLTVDQGHVNLYEFPWIYVIDQFIHGAVVPFKEMSSTGALLCLLTWLGFALNRSQNQQISLLFKITFGFSFLNSLVSFSRVGIWGSLLIILFNSISKAHSNYRNQVYLMAATFAFFCTLYLVKELFAEPNIFEKVQAMLAKFKGIQNEVGNSSYSQIFTLVDQSTVSRIGEFQTLFFGQSFKDLIWGSPQLPVYCHSFLLKIAFSFGLFGLFLSTIPFVICFVFAIRQSNNSQISSVVAIVLIILIFFDVPPPWLVFFPILISSLNLKS